MISAVHFTSAKVISEILETPLPIYLNSKELLNHTKPFHILYQVDKLGFFSILRGLLLGPQSYSFSELL